MRKIAIELEDVYFDYPDGNEAIRGISCRIPYGEKVAIIGHNGAGKSTLMSLLNGVLLPQKGRVLTDGIVVNRDNLITIRRKVGIVFQDPDDQLFCPTVYEDVAFGPSNMGLSGEGLSSKVQEALKLVGLSGFEGRSSFHLSFGERKRLALATVLSYEPEILIFDEPSTNMDPSSRRRLIEWLKSSDKTILLCTHDLDIALEACHRCIVLREGIIVADGPSCEILYDRDFLESCKLELPLSLKSLNLLQDILSVEDMDEMHRRVIRDFLQLYLDNSIFYQQYPA